MFHMVGIACMAASLVGGTHVRPDCSDFESPTDYPSFTECRRAANPAAVPVPKSGAKWIVLHCAQVPETPSKQLIYFGVKGVTRPSGYTTFVGWSR
jgi:hypothetical protein